MDKQFTSCLKCRNGVLLPLSDYGRDGAPASAPIIATLADGRRVVATPRPEILASLAGRSLVGETVRVSGGHPVEYTL